MDRAETEERVERLHAETVVVNSYGGPYTSTRVLRKHREGHWQEGEQRWIPGNPPFARNLLLPELRAGGVDVILGGYGEISEFGTWLLDLQESKGAAAIVSTPEGMQEAKEKGRIGLQICLHGPRSIEAGLDILHVHRQLGASVFTLCSSYRNAITDGCREAGNAGLSRYGRTVVRELNRLGIAVDVSHISQRGFWDVMDASAAPPIVTHSAAKALCDSARNMDDEQIKAVAGAGGYFGVIFFPAYLAPKNATIEHLLDHIDHIASVAGVSCIGLGADFCTYGWEWTAAVWERSAMPERRYRFPAGIEHITEWKNVTRGLIRRGYADDEIRGILGDNYRRVLGHIQSLGG